ncbi:MAG TPA: DPP IV N-terminal domain-containing protein [Flavobacterium sp.]
MKNILKTISILSILFISCSKTDEVPNTILTPPSANENKILFDANIGNNSHLFTMNIDGTNEKQITNFTDGTNYVSTYEGSWSPDGTKIIFLSNKDKDGGSKIYTINSDGTNLVRINHNARDEDSPKFSPDGKKIVFDANVGNNTHIFTMNIDGTNEKQITNFTDGTNYVSAYTGSWSPDGTKIIFLSNKDKDGGSKIYTINSDGTNLVRINHNVRGEDSPTWK